MFIPESSVSSDKSVIADTWSIFVERKKIVLDFLDLMSLKEILTLEMRTHYTLIIIFNEDQILVNP